MITIYNNAIRLILDKNYVSVLVTWYYLFFYNLLGNYPQAVL